MNSLKNGSGKIFALFAPFARLRTRRATAAFSAALLAAVMVMAALFFAGCINPEAEDVITPPPPESKLSITPQGKSISPGSNVDFTAKMTDGSPVTGVSWKILGTHNDSTTISGGKLTVGQDETAEQFTVIATYNGMLARATVTVAVAPPYFWKGVPVEGAVDKKSIKEKFDVTLTGTAGVEAAFKELSAFIQKGGLAAGVINLGDYIDLEGGLQIADAGGSTFSSGSVDWNGDIAGGHGKLSRLIVVGINSFNKKNGNDTPHVVFQFQNITHDRQMNATGSNEGGYAASDMRKYLSGPFLAGLIDAGVPDQVLWPPARKVSARTNIEDQVDPAEIQDKLWLPTAWEMGSATQHTLDETAANQARLEYYQDDPSRVKYGTSGAKQYWLASMTSDSYSAFVSIKINGAVLDSGGYLFSPMDAIGVAPAFCVYGGPDAPAGQ